MVANHALEDHEVRDGYILLRNLVAKSRSAAMPPDPRTGRRDCNGAPSSASKQRATDDMLRKSANDARADIQMTGYTR